MKKLLKKTTAVIVCTSLITGCPAILVAARSEPVPQINDPLFTGEEPAVADESAAEEADTETVENWYDRDPVETNVHFAQQIIEASDAYYGLADEQGSLSYFSYTTKNYDGDDSEEEKYAVVYTPYGYDASSQYDIMYLMHGVYGYAEIFLGYPGEETEMKNCIDHMIEEGMIRPMIIVCMSYYDNNEQEINDNEDADITKAFSQEFQNDLMPAVESSYSTYAASTSMEDLAASRDHRIFAGFSMGGVTTWYAFMQSMSYCRYYLVMSGMLYWGPDSPADPDGSWSGQMLSNALRSQGYGKNDFYIYMATGGYDEAKPFLESQIRSMKKKGKAFTFGSPFDQGVNCTYAYSEYEDHSWAAVFQYLYNGLPVISKKIDERG